MTRTEHLLSILAEECSEVAHRASKALRFGLEEIQEGQGYTNSDRISIELVDLLAVVEMLEKDGALDVDESVDVEDAKYRKKQKVEKYLLYAEECGTLQEGCGLAFEKWAHDKGMCLDTDFFSKEENKFVDPYTHLAYEIWLASRASA